MAKNLFNPLEDPPTTSSSEEDEVETSSEKDEEQISNSSKQGSDSDSPAVKSEKKRASEGTTKDMNVKRAKKSSREDKKNMFFQRIWSEEDELSLLQGMIDFKAETGTSPYDDMNEFYDIVKEYIIFDVSKPQFIEKIRTLKRKYFVKKVVKSSHDKKCLGLAKYIWGSDGMALESAFKSSVNSKKIEEEEEEKKEFESDKEVLIHGDDSESTNWFEKSFLVQSIVSLGVDEYSVKQKWSKVSMETKKRIEEKLKLVKAKEFELLLVKTDILKEVSSVISEVI